MDQIREYHRQASDNLHHTDSDDVSPLKLRATFISDHECSRFWEDWFKVPDSDSCSTK